MSQTILIVDDDAHIRDVIRFAVTDAGFDAIEASDGAKALALHKAKPVDLIILDIGMPEMDGFAACREIRNFSDVPILFLTAHTEEIDRVLAFELGADDYVAKPFSPRELILRIRARLKKTAAADPKVQVGDLILNEAEHSARLQDAPIDLTATEFRLLSILAKAPTRVFPKGDLLDQVYGNIFVELRTLDSHVRNLRKKARDAGCEDLVATVHGVGLRLGDCKC